MRHRRTTISLSSSKSWNPCIIILLHTEIFMTLVLFSLSSVAGFVILGAVRDNHRHHQRSPRLPQLHASKYTSLPPGLSPFDKSTAKSLDVQGKFRQLAAAAIQRAVSDKVTLMEVEFPPLLGGRQSKTSFDDFDNISELNANRDWCAQLAPILQSSSNRISNMWLVFADDKECELAAKEWTGQRYRNAAIKFTSIRAATEAALNNRSSKQQLTTAKAWGSTLASSLNKLTGGDGILADSRFLDDLEASSSKDDGRFHLVCQPGNGGPVEDWINVQALHQASSSSSSSAITTCIVSGALDKVRDGYYPAMFFPALAKTIPFYRENNCQAVFYLKPISDKGVYGWLFRVYPEPWQVILQTPITRQQGGNKNQQVVTVQETVALVSERRPTYAQAVQALLAEASEQQQQRRK